MMNDLMTRIIHGAGQSRWFPYGEYLVVGAKRNIGGTQYGSVHKLALGSDEATRLRAEDAATLDVLHMITRS